MLTVGTRVRSRRQELGLSIRALSACGVSKGFICRVEQGFSNPSRETLRRLAPMLEVSAYWLETGQEDSDLSALPSPAGATRVLGYVRVSTVEQEISGLGLQAQRDAIIAECERRAWTLLQIVEDAGWSGGSMNNRPGIQRALHALNAGDADALIAAKLDRLSRSMIDFTNLLAASRKQGWTLLALDCAVDTTTPAGEAMANMLATFAQFERRLISQRTSEAMAVRRAQGAVFGRPVNISNRTIRRMQRERAQGKSFNKIAHGLNSDGVPTAQGGACWYGATIRHTLNRVQRTSRILT